MKLIKQFYGIFHYDNGTSIGMYRKKGKLGWSVRKKGIDTKYFIGESKQEAIKYAEKL